MKLRALTAATLSLLASGSGQVLAQGTTQPDRHASLRQEMQLAYQRGLDFLKTKQAANGQWGSAEPVAFTGLISAAFLLDPARKPDAPIPPEAQKGTDYLLTQVQPDGGIYVQARANYNTALALMALLLNPQPRYEQTLLAARRFLISRQTDLDEPGKNDNPLDGGIGYGDERGHHADLSNTAFVLEALHYAEVLLADKGDAARNEPQLNFAAAIDFIQRCQNRTETNSGSWVSAAPEDQGGFVYSPGDTRGESYQTSDGRTALRSYGSISYAGMMSFIYAGLTREDPRVQAAMKWLTQNYTLDENPGMGAQGQFYYYHTMAKALNAAQVDFLKLADGQTVDWRQALAEKLLAIQQGDGSWVNSGSARWMESDPELVTGYILMALARIYETL
ncbi:MAG: cycloartenol synthase [Verrucomicrobiales bacterium]|nr:cycloartenol synthase [Verrucomicrobiales bacterium]